MIPAECSTFRADEAIPLDTTYSMEAPGGDTQQQEVGAAEAGGERSLHRCENCWQKGLKREKETPDLSPLQHKKREGNVSILKY